MRSLLNGTFNIYFLCYVQGIAKEILGVFENLPWITIPVEKRHVTDHKDPFLDLLSVSTNLRGYYSKLKLALLILSLAEKNIFSGNLLTE